MATGQDIVERYEMKYVIPRIAVAKIRDFIRPFCKPDPNTRGTPPEYLITTLQLDTPDYRLHFAKQAEMENRFKLRVRTYGDIGTSPVFAEIKAKLEHTIVKTRAQIPFDVWGRDLVYGVRYPDVFQTEQQELDFLKFRKVVLQTAARPAAVIRYTRESYIGTLDSYVRITFDRKLEYQATDSWTDFGRTGIWRSMDSQTAQGFGLPYSGVVLEVKTLSNVPVWVQELVERFELVRSGNCKYSTAIWREGDFAGWPGSSDAQMDEYAAV